jgi:hypothetical protein
MRQVYSKVHGDAALAGQGKNTTLAGSTVKLLISLI